jgi:non-ribosomal peptide synthetase component F
LALRLSLAGNPSFDELLGAARRVTLEAYTHQDLPFDKLVEALNPERRLGRTPVFQAKLVLQNAPVPALNIRDVSLRQFGSAESRDAAKFDLLLTLAEDAGGLRGGIEYSLDRLEPRTVTRMIRHFEALLGEAVSRRGARVEELHAALVEVDRERDSVERRELKEAGQQIFGKLKRRATDEAQA